MWLSLRFALPRRRASLYNTRPRAAPGAGRLRAGRLPAAGLLRPLVRPRRRTLIRGLATDPRREIDLVAMHTAVAMDSSMYT